MDNNKKESLKSVHTSLFDFCLLCFFVFVVVLLCVCRCFMCLVWGVFGCFLDSLLVYLFVCLFVALGEIEQTFS